VTTTRWVATALGGPEVLRILTVELGAPGPILYRPLWLRLLMGGGATSQAAAGPSPPQARWHGSLLGSPPVARAAS